MAYRILTATYTDRIETLLFDAEAKSLSITSSLTAGHRPSWITPHPENPGIWFTALEQEDGRVVAIKYDKDGKGSIVEEVSSEGAEPCTLVAYDGNLLVGNVSCGFPSRLLGLMFTGTFIDARVVHCGPTSHIVCGWKHRRVFPQSLVSLCCAVYNEARAYWFGTR